MIKSVLVTNHLGESIKMEMGRPEKSGLLIKDIDGLGPTKAEININESITLDGGSFNSSRCTPRNIVFQLGFVEMPTIEESRQLTYKYFPIKKRIQLVFETDTRSAVIEGYVESNTPDIFSASTETTISIICPFPHFRSYYGETFFFNALHNNFEFSFYNESEQKQIEFGIIEHESSKNILYKGEIETGISIIIHATGNVTGLVIYNRATREQLSINDSLLEQITGDPIKAGDDIVITTKKNEKSIILFRDGLIYNIINSLGANSDWIGLENGDNPIMYTVTDGATNLYFSIEYEVLFGGL